MTLEPLSEVAEIVMGQSPPSSTYNKKGNGLPFFQGKADFGNRYPRVRIYCNLPAKIAERGDILISVRAPVGPTNIARSRCCIGRGLAAIRVKKVDPTFLLHFFRYYEPQLAMQGKGSTFEAVNRDDLENLPVPLPQLGDQRKIAALLEKADRLRGMRRYARQLSDTFLQSVFLEMFGDPLTNNMQWAETSLSEATDNLDSRRVPVEASERTTRKGPYPYYGASGIIDWVDEFIFDEETLLVAEDGANLIARSTQIAFIATGKYWVNNHAHVLRVRENANIHFLEQLLNETDLERYITGSAQPKLTAAKLSALPIIMPPLPLQRKFADIVRRFERLRTQQREAERQAEHLFQTLLHRAFSSTM